MHNVAMLHTIDLGSLEGVNGAFSWDRMVDNGNRYGTAGALVGAGGGAVVGGILGAPAAGVGALPGAALGAGIGGAALGAAGWVGGAAVDTWNQMRGH